MRVLFLSHRVPYAPNRGDRIRAYHMLQFLGRHASVDLLSFAHDAEEAEQSLGRLPLQRATIVRTTPWRNRARSVVALPGSTPLTHTLLDSPDAERAVAAAVDACRPDVVFAFCTGVARLALCDALRDVPLVLDMVDVDSAKWRALATSGRPPLAWVYSREARCLGAFEQAVMRRAVATLVVNEKERLLLGTQPDVHVIPNGIDLDGFHPPGELVSSQDVVFCGVMNYQPNEEAAIRLVTQIWPRVSTLKPSARLLIVGAHPTARLRRLAAAYPSVTVTGAVPEVKPYLWQAAVSVAPLVTARGLQNKVLEALAAGLPVVTTTAVAEGLPAEALPGCVITDDPEKTARAIVDLLEAPPAARRQRSAQSRLRGLSWNEQLAPLEAILASVAARRDDYP